MDTSNPGLSPIAKDIELTALVPTEMVNAQQQLITWCDSKLIALRFESKELFDATEHAKKSKWKYTTLQTHYNKSLKKISYYEKVKAALLEGYYIVPNFPIQMFAIRTKGRLLTMQTNSYFDDKTQEAKELSIGEGGYKNPFPLVRRRTSKQEGGKEVLPAMSYAEEWDEMEFPITMAKPKIMQATSYAMSLKIFDQIGIMPSVRKNEDPVIIGQIFTKNGYSKKLISFMIAWHLNTNVI